MRTVTGRTDHVVVVGAGLAGLSAALHLAGRGRQVTVLERAGGPGGRAGCLDVDGYRLDTGPTVLTMPEIVEETFAAVGARMADRLTLTRLDPAYRAMFADGTALDVHADADAMADAVTAFAGAREAAGYLRLREWLTALYEAEFDRYIAANLDAPWRLLTPQLARVAALGAFGRLDRAIGRFVSDERLRRVFSFQALYVGEPPQRARAAYAVIAYMDTIAGVYFPGGGMRALPAALAGAASAAGVRIRYHATVTELIRRGDRITAAVTGEGDHVPCDAVVLTTELPLTYRLLGRTPRRVVPLRASPSAVVVHLGLPAGTSADSAEGASPGVSGLAHHTLVFGGAWRRGFDEIIERGELMSDPSLLVTRPTATDAALAPAGSELLSVLAPVPNLARGALDWPRLGPRYAESLLAGLAKRLQVSALDGARPLHLITPHEWAASGMVAGTPFSYAHTLAQSGPLRPSNLPRGVENAVLAGGGTVPGVGVPTALLSGRLAADRITGPVPAGRGR